MRNAEETRRNAEETRRVFQFTFLSFLRNNIVNSEDKERIDILILNFYKKMFGDIPGELPEKLLPKETLIMYLQKDIIIKEAKECIEKGDIARAEQILERYYYSDTANEEVLEQYINTLIMFRSKEKCEKVWSLIQEKNPGNFKLYRNLAYLFWELGEIDKSVEIVRKGLDVIEKKSGDSIAIAWLKNSLAYYYADADSEADKPKFESRVRDLIEQVCNTPNIPSEVLSHFLDTKGYIKIVYGDKEEIMEGMALCAESARDLKGNIDKLFLERHTRKFYKRLTQLPINKNSITYSA